LTTLYMVWLKDDIGHAVNHVWNHTFGRVCCGYCGCSEKRRDETACAPTEIHISGFQPEDTQISSSATFSHKVHSSSLFEPVGKTNGTSLNSVDLAPSAKSRDKSHLFVKEFMSDAWGSDGDEELYTSEKVSAHSCSVEMAPSEKARDDSHLFVKQFMSDAWASDDDEELDNSEKVSVDVEQPKTIWNTNHVL